jgi:hypothetical protein
MSESANFAVPQEPNTKPINTNKRVAFFMVKDFNNWSFEVISCVSKETTAQKHKADDT